MLELLEIVLGGLAHDLGQLGGAGAFVPDPPGLLRHHHAHAPGQFLHRIDEAQARILHEEADGRAVGAAAEAVIELLGRADGERRRLFVVEGTAGGVVGPRLFQRYVAVNEVDDVDPVQQFLEEGFGDHGRQTGPATAGPGDFRRRAGP